MPVVVRDGNNRQGGVYQAVRAAVEEDARLHAERIAGWSVDPADYPYPLQRILDALRAGEPTDAPGWMLPDTARGMVAARNTGEATCFYVAVVRPDDTVTFEPDDGSKTIEYLGV